MAQIARRKEEQRDGFRTTIAPEKLEPQWLQVHVASVVSHTFIARPLAQAC